MCTCELKITTVTQFANADTVTPQNIQAQIKRLNTSDTPDQLNNKKTIYFPENNII